MIITPVEIPVNIKKDVDIYPVLLMAKIGPGIPKDAKTVSVLTPTGEFGHVYIKEVPITRSPKNNRVAFKCPLCGKSIRIVYYPLSISLASDTWLCRHCVIKNVPVIYKADDYTSALLWATLKTGNLYRSTQFNGDSFRNAVLQIEKLLNANGKALTPKQKKDFYNRSYLGEVAYIEFIKLLSAHKIANTDLGRMLLRYWKLRDLIINQCVSYDKHLNWAVRQDDDTFSQVLSMFSNRGTLYPTQKQLLMEPIYRQKDPKRAHYKAPADEAPPQPAEQQTAASTSIPVAEDQPPPPAVVPAAEQPEEPFILPEGILNLDD